MAIETICGGCAKMLRVADEHAGKKARCPHCGYVYDVPAATSGPAASEIAARYEGEWFLRTTDGKTYGPVSYQELLSWRREGRVVSGCELRGGDSQEWFPATRQFPDLQAQSPSVTQMTGSSSANPFAETTENPYASPATSSTGGLAGVRPHRGGMISTFGLVCWAIGCFGGLLCGPLGFAGLIFGIMAWVMGVADLRDMRAGRMDPAGESSTRIGMISGMVFCVFSILATVGAIAFVILAIAMDA